MMETPAPPHGQGTGQVLADRTEFRARPIFSGKGQNAVEILAGPGKGTIHRFDTQLLIGRAARCGLVIDDATVSREHLLIDNRGGQWVVASRSQKNPALKNGLPFQVGPIATGDTLTVGPAVLRFVLTQSRRGAALSPGFARLWGNKRLLIGGSVGVFVLTLVFFFLSQPTTTPQEAVVANDWGKQQAMQNAEYIRKVSTLLIQARRLHEEGQDEQALARLDSLLAIDADDDEAQRFKAELQAGIKEKAATEKIRREQAALALEKVRPLLREAESLLAVGNMEGAKAVAKKAQAQAPEVAEVAQIMEKIEAKEAAAKRQAAQKATEAAEKRQGLTGLYAEAEAALDADALYQALVIYRRLGEEEGEPARSSSRKKAAEIQDALVKRVMPDFSAGQKLYNQKKYAEAYTLWVKVLEIYPEAKETKAKVAELTPMLEAEAKRLYEEGLVYEGLGDRAAANARWHAVLETMPRKDDAYYRRAADKLGIAEAGKGRP